MPQLVHFITIMSMFAGNACIQQRTPDNARLISAFWQIADDQSSRYCSKH
jgi:uncharacterized protein affecting Mg2+/Co2+ transport